MSDYVPLKPRSATSIKIKIKEVKKGKLPLNEEDILAQEVTTLFKLWPSMYELIKAYKNWKPWEDSNG